MNELERDYLAAKALGLETFVLLLRLWVILFCVFAGLWVLGVIIMFWWAAIPIALIGAWWFFNSNERTRSTRCTSKPSPAMNAPSGRLTAS